MFEAIAYICSWLLIVVLVSAANVAVFLPDHDYFYFSLFFFLDKAYQGLLTDYSLKEQILFVWVFFVIFIVSFLFNHFYSYAYYFYALIFLG